MVVLVTLETKVGEVEGMMNLCIPYLTIEPIISKLSAQYWYSSPQRDSAGTGVPAAVLESLPVESLVFAETDELTLRELAQLRPGRRIRLPRFAGGEACLSAGTQPVVRLHRMPAPRRPGGRAGGRLAFAVEPSPARSPSPPDGPQELVRQVQEALERLGREIRQQLPEKRAPAGPRPEPAGYPTFGDIDAAAEAEEPPPAPRSASSAPRTWISWPRWPPRNTRRPWP